MCLIRLLMSFLMHQGRARLTLWWANRKRIWGYALLVCVWCHVSLCAGDMPMINLQPHLYATARETDRRAAERKDHLVRAWFREHLRCLCVCVWGGECSLPLTCHWLLSDAGADSGEGGRIWDAALSAEYLQPRGGPSNQGRRPRSRGHSEAVALFPREQKKTRQTFIKTGNAMKRLDLELQISRLAYSHSYVLYLFTITRS